MTLPSTVIAAGALVVRRLTDPTTGLDSPQVLLVHRPHHDDWSYPKGKLDAGETIEECAVREVAEETGMEIELGERLPDQTYDLPTGRPKRVHYWLGTVTGTVLDEETFVANEEVDAIVWATAERAAVMLTHSHDRDLLETL